MNNSIITVSQLNFYVKSVIDGCEPLKNIFIAGEISNLNDNYRSGHIYLSMKDEKSVLKCVMFASYSSRLRFKPQNGMKIIARGRISVYEQTGQYQFYIEDMQPDGAGALAVAFEQLKEKLGAKGYFSAEHKKSLPKFPEKIGVITSPTGAARRDIEQILKRRFPPADILFYSAQVQGQGAAAELISGIRYFNKHKNADVIIIGRGGGSAEDLSAFNDEGLADEIFFCEIPVISAVGHETDFSISDFVADVRAATPSAAAEIAVPDIFDLNEQLANYKYTMFSLVNKKINTEKLFLDKITKSKSFGAPVALAANYTVILDRLHEKLGMQYASIIRRKKSEIMLCTEKIQSLNPLAILAKGYGILTDDKEKSIKSTSDVCVGDMLNIRLSDGTINCTVNEIEDDINEKNDDL